MNIIEIPSTDIEFINEINSKQIYKFHLGDCDYFFRIDNVIDTFDYISLLMKNNVYLINVKGNLEEFETIKSIISPRVSYRDIEQQLIPHYNILIADLKHSKCIKAETQLNVENAKLKREELNTILKVKCPNLELKLDYMYNFSGGMVTYNDKIEYLILCLNTEEGCVSSIEIVFRSKSIEINSKTAVTSELRKYNKILRAVVIIIAKLLNDEITGIESTAINPISAWLLINYFNSF